MPSLMNFLQSKLISKGVKCRVFVIVIQVMQECQMLVELSKILISYLIQLYLSNDISGNI